ncbi:SesA protein [Nannizzia gypsea CBS 118893]|uniref:SesA protein n=1 Tax=Arthroderma gypseum (strain ATCC MYA-4604 / CBS 118893) TaxID=535722 RepID=E4V1Q9_ARTGP|nr:SesA protein [Nannizzia gypsea CBS 118893]EFR03974.1 SesA protein [Nannizzia gypsea CBS 118893]
MASKGFTALISITISILTSITRDCYTVIEEDKTLRDSFHEAGRGLPFIEEALRAIKSELNGRDINELTTASLETCSSKSQIAERVFRDVALAPADSRCSLYTATVRREGKGNSVEELVKEMISDVCNMVKDSAIEEPLKIHIKALRKAIKKLSNMEPSVPEEPSDGGISYHGSGNQFNALGGTQNNIQTVASNSSATSLGV